MRPQSAQVIDLAEYRQQRRVARNEHAPDRKTLSGSALTMQVALWWFPMWTWMPVCADAMKTVRQNTATELAWARFRRWARRVVARGGLPERRASVRRIDGAPLVARWTALAAKAGERRWPRELVLSRTNGEGPQRDVDEASGDAWAYEMAPQDALRRSPASSGPTCVASGPSEGSP